MNDEQTRMESVVVAVDGSEHSLRALQWAARAAGLLSASLLVAHVLPEDLQVGLARIRSLGQDPQIADPVLETVKGSLAPRAGQLSVRYVSLEGSVAEALTQAARGAGMLVVGSRGRGGFASLLLGSTSRALAATAPCPVVVVPHEARTPKGPAPGPVSPAGSGPETSPAEEGQEGRRSAAGGGGRVLLGLHPQETHDDVIAFACAMAELFGGGLEVVSAYPVPPSPMLLVGAPAPTMPLPEMAEEDYSELARQTVRQQEERLAPHTARHPHLPLSPVVVPADAAGQLVDDAEGAALVVVGRHHRHRGGHRLLMGSVAHAVLHHAPCPVAVVPAAGQAEG
ncbi:universal stress protein [Streptomyces purpureus]|uniref:universal stress protein n=1 Tax=Streptomyces purpureus TaxID=1951 RepID=UPI0003A93449|nr:universal stress protein [Streptomyces purpureus]